MRALLSDVTLLDPEGTEPWPGSILVEDGRIAAVLGAHERAPEDVARTPLDGALLAPGFIDLHHHGELIYAAPEEIEHALRRTSLTLSRSGTTAFLPTTVTASSQRLDAIMTQIEAVMTHADWPGAVPLGVHLEGPWINRAAAGAQPDTAVRGYGSGSDVQLLDRHRELIAMVTCAPECEGATRLVGQLADAGVAVALGHSLASPEQIDAAVSAGMTHVTHLFNAMGELRHRAPSVAGHVIAESRLSCDLICDGVHVHPDMVVIAARALGERLILISDQIAVPAGPHPDFGAGPVHDDGEAIRLADGRLAGSSLSLDRAVRRATRFHAMALLEAIAAVSLRPARLLGVEAERGTLRPGARADFAVLDAAGHVRETWIAGRRVD